MHEVIHVLKHAFVDTLKIAPILLVVYFLIEFLEYKKLMQFQKSKMLNGRASPVFGSLFGSVPQCGFSVISTDLYTKGVVSIGALLSVYIATSDEAIPIMLSHSGSWLSMLCLILAKIVLGVIVGYLAIWLYPKVFKTKHLHLTTVSGEDKHIEQEHNHDEHHEVEHHVKEQESHEHIGCCHHDLESSRFDWKHPLLHCLKILAFILLINIIFDGIIEWVGKDKLTDFLSYSSAVQPLLAVLIGLIPNCASSVVITELYLLNGISFGAVLAGLSVNAGLGLMVLFKQNKNVKETIFIMSMLIIPSLLAGYILHFIPLPI